MQELSMNILDIAQNSVKAGASLIKIDLEQNTENKEQVLRVQDNGKGMSSQMLQNVTDPFCTSRITRKVGLGIPFLKMAAELTGGKLELQSTKGAGTVVIASFTLGHIDLAPLGNMGETIAALVQCNPNLDFVFTYKINKEEFIFDTREARAILGDVPLSDVQVAVFIQDLVSQNILQLEKIQGGAK